MPVDFRSDAMRDGTPTDRDGTGPRPISWSAWSPAVADAVEAPMRVEGPGAPWLHPPAEVAPSGAGSDGMPVVLASHGTGRSAASLGWLGRALAADGFVVLNPTITAKRPSSLTDPKISRAGGNVRVRSQPSSTGWNAMATSQIG